jgi:hypothetical protein
MISRAMEIGIARQHSAHRQTPAVTQIAQIVNIRWAQF